jgi:hypothetical protein
MAREHVESLGTSPSWDETSIHNVCVLVAMILPNHDVIARLDPEPLVNENHVAVKWWNRFRRIYLEYIYDLPPATEEMLAKHPFDAIASLNVIDLPMSTNMAHATCARQMDMLSRRAMFMFERDMTDPVNIVMHIVFYAIVCENDTWS